MIEIQEMTAADVADIAALERLCFSAPWSENSIAEELETGFSLWLVAVSYTHLTLPTTSFV